MKPRRTARPHLLAHAGLLLVAAQIHGADLELLEFLGSEDEASVQSRAAEQTHPYAMNDSNPRKPTAPHLRRKSDDDEDHDPHP